MQNIHLKIETGVHTSGINKFVMTSDGGHFLSSGQDKTIRVWDPIAKKEIRKFIGAIGPGDYGNFQNFILTPDDKYVITNVRRIINNAYDDAIRIYDFLTGKLVKQFDTQRVISGVSVSPDNQMIAVADFDGLAVTIWELSKFLQSDYFPIADPKVHINLPQNDKPFYINLFNQADQYFVVTSVANFHSGAHYLSLYSLEDQDFVVEQLPYPDSTPTTIAVNHQHIAVNHHGKKINIYNRRLNFIRSLPAACNNLAYSPDGTLLICDFTGQEQCTVYDAKNDYAIISKLGHYQNRASGVGFLNNSTAVTGGGNLNEIHFWDPISGKQRGHIPGIGKALFAVGINGSTIAFGNTQDKKDDQNNYAPIEKQFNINDLLDDSFHIEEIEPEQISTFNRAVTEHNGNSVSIRSANLWVNHQPLTGLKVGGTDVWYFAESFGFTPDGFVVTGNRGGGGFFIRSDATYIAKFTGHNNTVWDLAIDGNRMVTCGEDQIIRLWNLEDLPKDHQAYQGKRVDQAAKVFPMLNIFITDDGEWIVWSHSGFYTASLYGDKYVGYHVNQGEHKEALFFPSDRFVDSLYRPDVIKEIINTGSEVNALENLAIDVHKIQDILPAQIEFDGSEVISTEKEEFELNFKLILSNEQPIQRVVLFNNDLPAWEIVDQNITQSTSLITDAIHLLPGENKLKILAYGEHSRSLPKTITVNRTGEQIITRGTTLKNGKSGYKVVKPNLYLLAIGVSEYKFAGKKGLKNLGCAHHDADQLSAYFSKQQGRAFGKVHKSVLTNKKATKANILKALNALKVKIVTREDAKKDKKEISRDVFMVFLAGHGIKSKQSNKFYFMPHDCNPEKFDTTALLITEIGDVMNAVSTEFVILTDACHSGAVGGHFNTLEFTKRWLATHDRAQLIFNATTANMLAIEKKFKKHGVFTLGILEELKASKTVSAIQLCHKVSQRVKILSGNKQTPALTVYGSLVDYEIYK